MLRQNSCLLCTEVEFFVAAVILKDDPLLAAFSCLLYWISLKLGNPTIAVSLLVYTFYF